MVVEPDATPETTPELLTIATALLLLLHVPPEAVLVRDNEEPAQMLAPPLILPASGDTPVVTV